MCSCSDVEEGVVEAEEEDVVEEFYVDSYRSGHFCLPPEGQEEVNLLILVVVLGIISFFFHI